MRLLKFELRRGLIASALAAVLLLFIVPNAYDALGEGPKLVKASVQASAKTAEVCAGLNRFFIIPWRLSIEDSDSRGDLDISYWVFCIEGLSRVEASLGHSGGTWQIKKIDLVRANTRQNLLN
jgi:hypothetical protein